MSEGGLISFEPIPPERFADWAVAVGDRFAEHRVASGSMSGPQALRHSRELVSALLPDGPRTPGHALLLVKRGGMEIGHVWLRVQDAEGDAAAPGREAFVFDVALATGAADAAGVDLMAATERVARERGAGELRVNVFSHDQATLGLVADCGFQPAATQMRLTLDAAIPSAVRSEADIALSLMSQERFAAFRAQQEAQYAADLLRSGTVASEREAARRAGSELDEDLPDGLRSPGQSLWCAHRGTTDIGHLWLEEEWSDGALRVFVHDLAVHEGFRRRGHGRTIMEWAVRRSQERGASSIGLSVFGFNEGARALYRGLGFRTTEELLWKPLRAGGGEGR